MGDDGTVARLERGFEHLPEVHRRSDGGGLDQHGFFAVEEQVAVGEPLLVDGVDHVFGGEVELEPPFVHRFQFFETGPDLLGRIRDILHDVGREPDFGDSLLLHDPEDGQGVFLQFHAVVQPVQDVGVLVDSPLQKAALLDGAASVEQSEHQDFFSSDSLP